jgi:RNA polymerase sigma-70 factor (ECF subfamily)
MKVEMETKVINKDGSNKDGSETDLVARIRAGDQHAEAELVERYNHGLKIIIRREVSDAAAVEDLYQETFRIVLEKIRQGGIRDPERLSGFVRSVAKNLVIDYFREAVRQVKVTEVKDAAPIFRARPDQLEELLRKETADLIRQILEGMSNERDVQVLFRFYLAEDDKEKICADLGLTSLHFNVVLQRARDRFRALYQRALGDKRSRRA